MTEKELHRLGRKDLLQLLVTQGREALTLQEELDGCHTKNAELDATLTRLKDKLDEKDALIEKLKGRLDQKDAQNPGAGRRNGRVEEKPPHRIGKSRLNC